MLTNVEIQTQKSIGARVNEELAEKIKYEAIKRNITQGDFIAQLYKGFSSKIKPVEIEALKEQAQIKELSRIAEEEAKAQRLEASIADNEVKQQISEFKHSASEDRMKAKKMELERRKDKANQKFGLQQDDQNASVVSKEEVA
jgi:hypothetical protein